MKLSENKKKEGKYCCAYACRNEPVARKGGLCHKHYARKIRDKDPVYARYNQFCSKAASRGIENTITLDEFRAFCKRTGYIVNKGYRGQIATLDRMCNAHGYHIWNIQLMSNRANARKGNRTNGDNFDCPF